MASGPTTAELEALITMLQVQVAALVAASPAAPAVAAAAGHTVTFAEMPQTLNPDNLLNYSSKRGASVFEQGCKPLDNKALINGFGITPVRP
jgi:hypothetical protein